MICFKAVDKALKKIVLNSKNYFSEFEIGFGIFMNLLTPYFITFN